MGAGYDRSSRTPNRLRIDWAYYHRALKPNDKRIGRGGRDWAILRYDYRREHDSPLGR